MYCALMDGQDSRLFFVFPSFFIFFIFYFFIVHQAKAKQELEEEVARGMQELREAEAAEEGKVAPKKKKKIVKRKKKKQGSGSTEL